jgi:hypothetical protein
MRFLTHRENLHDVTDSSWVSIRFLVSNVQVLLHRWHNLYNKDTDWTAFMEKVKEKFMEIKTHNGLNREMDVKKRYENFFQITKEN